MSIFPLHKQPKRLAIAALSILALSSVTYLAAVRLNIPLAKPAVEWEVTPEYEATLSMISAHAPLRVPEVLDPDSKSNRTALDTMIRKSLLGKASQPPFVPDLPDFDSEIVGTLKGRFSVDNKGTGEYDLSLPDLGGRGAPTPSLSLSYSSRVWNANAGFRFYISDGYYNKISRGRNFHARDGEARGIELTRKDRFYLDGKRLLCVSDPETDGLPGCVYRTEVDGFLEVEAVGSDETIEGFVLRNKNGYTYYFGKYGGSVDAQHRGVLASDKSTLSEVTYDFALKRVENAFGYYATFTYEQLAPGNWHLRFIDYTGTPEQEPGNRIEYVYQASSRHAEYYDAMTVSHGRFVIDEIVVLSLAEAVPIAKYELVYEGGGEEGVLRLKEFRPYFASDVGEELQSMAPTRFYWSKGFDPDGDFELRPLPKSVTQPEARLLADLNGDDKSDLLTIGEELKVLIATSEGLPKTKPQTWGDLESFAPKSADSPQPTQVYAGEFNGDNQDDLLLVYGKETVQVLKSTGQEFSRLTKIDLSHLPAAPFEILPSDLNGDGRDDILVRTATGELQTFLYQKSGFPQTPIVNTLPISQETETIDIRGASIDLNGDGLDDYLWLALEEEASEEARSLSLNYCISISGTHFSSPVPLKKWSGIATTSLNDIHALSQEIGILIGDFNSDDHPDFALGTVSGAQCDWEIVLNKCHPTSILTPNAEQIATLSSVASTITLPHVVPDLDSPSTEELQPALRIGNRNLEVRTPNGPQLLDTDRDGSEDIVYQDLASANSRGKSKGMKWIALTSRGNGEFQDPRPLNRSIWRTLTSVRYKSSARSHPKLDWSHDINGDGLDDLLLLQVDSIGNSAISGIIDGVDRSDVSGPLRNMMVALTEGGGRTVCASYLAAKDDRAYTPGATVAYPIREIRGSGPVVTEVWKDEGSGNFAQFGYQYSGRRSDFSGRGSLGFAAFTTIDRHTGFLSFQQVIQSFPTTGLTTREEVYRTWKDKGVFKIKVIGVEDYASIYDAVTSPKRGIYYGTVYSYKSQFVETDWASDLNFHYTVRAKDLVDWSGSSLFIPQEFPSDSTFVRVENYWHDEQDQERPPPTEFQEVSYPYVLNPDAEAKNTKLPGLIHYGNQTLEKLDYGYGLFEQTATSYYPPSETHRLMGSLKKRVEASSNLDGEGDKLEAPEEYEYVPGSNYLSGEWAFNSLSTETSDEEDTYYQYPRDALGRQTLSLKRVLDGNLQPIEETVETRYQASDFDPITDEPTRITYNDGEERTLSYNPIFNQSKKTYYDRGITVYTRFDGLGRKVSITNPDYEYVKTVNYQWTRADAKGWLSHQTILPPKGSEGVPNQSIYAEIISETNEPTKLYYYDQAGRVIRIIEIQDENTYTTTDTVFDSQGREVANSEPYTSNSPVTWTINHHDAYGSVSHTTEIVENNR